MARYRPDRLAEFERMRRRLSFAFLALLLLVVLGTLGFAWIGGEGGGFVNSLYMTIITLTTVGYGEVIDMTHSPGGRIFTMFLLLGGMGIVAYAVPLLAAFLIEGHFLNIFSRRRMQKTIGSMSGHTIVCGASAAAWHVADELHRTQRDVVVVAPTPEDLEEAGERIESLLGLVGDASSDAVLLEAGIERAAGLVVCMPGDKDNVIIALTARRLAPRARIVASTEQPENEPKLRVAGADAVVSPARIGGLRMASELVRPHVVTFLDQMLRDEAESLRVEEVMVPEDSPVVGQSLGDLRLRGASGALVLAVVPPDGGRFEFNPGPGLLLLARMKLVVMTGADGRTRLEAMLSA